MKKWISLTLLSSFLIAAIGWEIWVNFGLVDGDPVEHSGQQAEHLPDAGRFATAGGLGCGQRLGKLQRRLHQLRRRDRCQPVEVFWCTALLGKQGGDHSTERQLEIGQLGRGCLGQSRLGEQATF